MNAYQFSLGLYRCILCDKEDKAVKVIVQHVVNDHPDWRKTLDSEDFTQVQPELSINITSKHSADLEAMSSSTTSHENTFASEFECSDIVKSKDASIMSTPHTNPNWLQNLRENLYSVAIEPCGKKVQDAVDNNVDLQPKRVKRTVRKQITDNILDHIQEEFGGVGRPKLEEMNKIGNELGFVYPAMFKYKMGDGYGLGGKQSSDAIGTQLLDALRDRDGNRAKTDLEKQKGKKVHRYGVNNDIYYKETPSRPEVSAKLSKVNKDMGYEEMEAIFEEGRPELMKMFRYLVLMIDLGFN